MAQADTVLQDMGKEICASAERLTKRYDHADHLMRDAVSGAMAWVPGYLSRGITPSVEQLTLLSAQLLAIAAATEASSQASKMKIGFR